MNEPVVPEVDELIASLRPRLADTVGDAQVDRLVREALADLGAVRVTTYLPILIERRVRQRVRMAPAVPAVPASRRWPRRPRRRHRRTGGPRHGLSRYIAASAVSSNAAGLSVRPVSIAT